MKQTMDILKTEGSKNISKQKLYEIEIVELTYLTNVGIVW